MYACMQASPIAAATTQGTVSVPVPKSKAVDNRTWAQRVSADGRKYFVDPVTRQTTWHDPVSADLSPYCHRASSVLLCTMQTVFW